MTSKRRSGQSLVEFAFALPVLLLLLLGMLDLGRAFYVREQLSDAARAALRTALTASQQSTANAACASSGGKVTVVLPATASSISAIASAADLADSPSGAASGTMLAGATLSVTWHCAAGAAITNATNGGVTDPADPRSDSVDVVMQYPLALLYPVIQQVAGPSVTLTAHQMGRVEY